MPLKETGLPKLGSSTGAWVLKSTANQLAWKPEAVFGLQLASMLSRRTVDSKKLEYGPGTIYAGFPSSLGFGVGGQSYSKFPASTVVSPLDIPHNPSAQPHNTPNSWPEN